MRCWYLFLKIVKWLQSCVNLKDSKPINDSDIDIISLGCFSFNLGSMVLGRVAAGSGKLVSTTSVICRIWPRAALQLIETLLSTGSNT